MVVSTRRERIKQATRQGTLDGGRQIVRHGGWPTVTIRTIEVTAAGTTP